MTKQIITAETVRLAWKAGESVIVYAKGDIVTQPVPPVLEEVPASQEPVHVPTPALTADQLVAAARQLQEALVPLTQALTASVAPAAQPVPPVVFTPGSNPMAAEAVAASAPAEQRSDDLLVAIRRGVLSALPAGTADEALIDRLIASVLAEMGACSAPETRPGVRQAGGVTHVDSKAQYWGGSRAKGSVAVMDVLSPAKGDAASVGYLDWENLSFSWTFRRTEVLVVLEGDLNLSIEGTTFSAAHGDVFSIPAGTEVELSSSGHVRCATVAVAA